MIKKRLIAALLALAVLGCKQQPSDVVADGTIKLSPSSVEFTVNESRSIDVKKGNGVATVSASSGNPAIDVSFDGDRTISVTAKEKTSGLIIVTADNGIEEKVVVKVNPDNRLTITPAGNTVVGEKRTKSFSVFKGASIGNLEAKSNSNAVAVRLEGSGNNFTLEATGEKIGEEATVWVQDDGGKQTPTITLKVLDLELEASTTVLGIRIGRTNQITFTKGKDVGPLRGVSANDKIATITTEDGVNFTVTGTGLGETQVWVVDDNYSIESDKATIQVTP